MSKQSTTTDVHLPPPTTTPQHPPPPSPHPKTTPWLTPARAFLFSTLPLGIGTYIGYRRALTESVAESLPPCSPLKTIRSIRGQSLPPPNTTTIQPLENSPTLPQIKVNAPLLAVRALAVGSLLSLSATSLLVSCIFYAAEAHSVEELMGKWRRWAPLRLREVERWLGVRVDRGERMEYEREVRGMSEEEELEYVRRRYGEEFRWEEG
ncbi:hypothetical protein HJC23_010688 [Cyclotella cryptica]|uniref:Transmembrane protein 242 n=1 Tax=Cyclotella cryptica TaxID=29204 RepID=A0ABD3P9R5_9STRA